MLAFPHAMKRRPIFPLLFLAASAYALFVRFHSSAFLTFYEDDAFYYFQIARNIVMGHGSSFDGTHLTNGYHPLWMLVIVPLMMVAHGKAFFVLLQAFIFLCFAATFLLLRSLFKISSFANLCAGVLALGCLLLLRGGMEITLTLPLALLLIRYRLQPTFQWTPRPAVVHGLLSALVILSRLDAILLVALLYLFDLLFRSGENFSSRPECVESARAEEKPAVLSGKVPFPSQKAFTLLAAATTLLPLAIYALINHHYFHTFTTVSSQAKQLRPNHTITLAQISNSLGPITSPYRILVVYPAAFLLLFAAITFLRRRTSQTSTRAANSSTILALILFPFLQLLAFLFLSDWFIWSWYIYSIPLAATGALLYLLRDEPSPAVTALLPVLQTALLLVVALYAAACSADRIHSRWYVFAEDIAPFAQAHPGIYAMGDCAGTPAWVTQRPFIQLEGLAMDEPFLDNIRHRRNLNDVLSSYNVRYYVTQDAVPAADGCYQTNEPYQGGPDSPRMHGRFCQPPVAVFSHGPGPRDTLRIFDLTK